MFGVIAVLWWGWSFVENEIPAGYGIAIRLAALVAVSLALGSTFFVWGAGRKWDDRAFTPRGSVPPKNGDAQD